MPSQQAEIPASHIHEYMYKPIEHEDTCKYMNDICKYMSKYICIYMTNARSKHAEQHAAIHTSHMEIHVKTY